MRNVRNYDHPSCCGVRVLSGMGYDDDSFRSRMEDILSIIEREDGDKEPRNNHHQSGKLYEITMTDEQIETSPKFVALLKENGFRLKSRWNNNSGQWCNLIVKNTAPSMLAKSPWFKE